MSTCRSPPTCRPSISSPTDDDTADQRLTDAADKLVALDIERQRTILEQDAAVVQTRLDDVGTRLAAASADSRAADVETLARQLAALEREQLIIATALDSVRSLFVPVGPPSPQAPLAGDDHPVGCVHPGRQCVVCRHEVPAMTATSTSATEPASRPGVVSSRWPEMALAAALLAIAATDPFRLTEDGALQPILLAAVSLGVVAMVARTDPRSIRPTAGAGSWLAAWLVWAVVGAVLSPQPGTSMLAIAGFAACGIVAASIGRRMGLEGVVGVMSLGLTFSLAMAIVAAGFGRGGGIGDRLQLLFLEPNQLARACALVDRRSRYGRRPSGGRCPQLRSLCGSYG